MRHCVPSFALTSLLLFGFNTVVAQSFKPKLANELQRTLDSLTTLFTNTKGMSAAVYAPGNGIWKGASGLSKAGSPVTSDMEFGIASNSKLFTAVVLLKLAENKKLNLDDSLHEWLSTYKNINPNITIRQLLNHSSGVSDPIFVAPLFDSIQANLKHVYTPQEVLTYLGNPLFAPGKGYGYSNVNYILAGMVAESATGNHISKLIRDVILTPLKMDSTFYDVEESERGTIAHRWYNNVDFHDSSRISLNTAGGAAGSIFSTGSEMVQWYEALFNARIINKASIAEMTTFSTNGNYGLGIQKQTLFGFETWGHGGRTLGYKSRMFYDPCTQITTCGLTNSDPSAVDGITALLHKVMLDRLPGCPIPISGATKVCKGSYETYVVHPIDRASTYEWHLPDGSKQTTNNNSFTVFFGKNTISGKISVRAVNDYGYGLTVEQNIEVIQIPLTVTNSGNTLTVDSAASGYQWLDCDAGMTKISGEIGRSYVAKKSGNYAVAIGKGNCWDTSACINVKLGSLEDFYRQNVEISPNPFSSSTTIDFTNTAAPSRLIIINMMGQIIREIDLSHHKEAHFTLDRDGLSSGLYNLHLVSEELTQFCGKVVVLE